MSHATGREHTPGDALTIVFGAVAFAVAVLAGGCVDAEGLDEGEDVGIYTAAATVNDHVYGGCSTEVVIELSKQIAEEVGCMMPGTLVSFEEGPGIVFTGSAVLPFLAPEAKADLLAAVAASGATIQINSAYRTVVQQYLLRRWYELGRCGITAAAQPGSSNHETGRALDVNNYSAWIGALGNRGWTHDIPGDPVHFDHPGSPDLRGADVLAFQRLWNRNHPEDPIAEDGDYGPATAARLSMSPPNGFAVGACPAAPPSDGGFGAEPVVAGGGEPASVASGGVIEIDVAMRNSGTKAWTPGKTFLGTTQPRDRASALFVDGAWIAPNRPATVSAETPPGQVGHFVFLAQAPEVTAETAVSESFGLVEEGVTWFGPEDVTVELVVRAPGGAGPADDPGGGAGPGDPTDNDLAGAGCSVAVAGSGDGVGAAGWLLGAGLLLLVRRRRRGRATSPSR